MDRNGYNPSIMQSADVEECYLCGVPFPMERHEVFGASNRDKSKEDGLWVTLCPICHRTGKYSVHMNGEVAEDLKAEAERMWCIRNSKTIDDFLERYGRNYIDRI